jgi:hypothetical protein
MLRPVITTYTGRNVNPLDPGGDINILDIAHSLALCNRFAGHTKEPISVAQHSVYVAALCPAHALQGLLHDASEAYLGDVTKWLKAQPQMEAYREAEHLLQAAIYRYFGVPVEQHESVTLADRMMVRWEGMVGFGRDWSVSGVNPAAHREYPQLTTEELTRIDMLFGGWRFWEWREAQEKFLGMFYDLTEK